jgi:hypothetical protein
MDFRAVNRPPVLAGALVRGGVWSIGILSAAGGISKAWDPRPSVEFAEAVTGRSPGAMVLVALVAGAECGLAAAILLRHAGAGAALRLGITWLLALSAWLAFAWDEVGRHTECACISLVRRTTVEQALMADLIVMVEVAAAYVLWRRWYRRGTTVRRRSPARTGPGGARTEGRDGALPRRCS